MLEKTNVKTLENVVVRFSGDSGDGMQLAGNIFSNVSAGVGDQISTFPDYPAEIRAPQGTLSGVSGFQVHIGKGVHTPGDLADVLVAMNPAALKRHACFLKKGGVAIVDIDSFKESDLKKALYETNDPFHEIGIDNTAQIVEVPVTSMVKNALAESGLDLKSMLRCRNIFALGLVCWLFDRPLESALHLLKNKFAKKPAVYEANAKVLNAGYDYGHNIHASVSTYRIETGDTRPGTYTDVNGNTATAWGLIYASEKSGRPLYLGSYPITPATDILHELAKRKDLGVKACQMEDEIAGVCSAIGAAFAGDLAVTTTSGPGLALKSEGIGLAVMAELPLVIVDVQRGGPSTGLPTKTEQTEYPEIKPRFVPEGKSDWHPYDRDENTKARYWAIPGTPGLTHRLGGLEKDSKTGAISTDPENHEKMVLLRQEKVDRVAFDIPDVEPYGDADADTLVIGWGGTFGHIHEAVDDLRAAGKKVAMAHFRYINPLPKNTGEVLARYKHVVVAELNLGQFADFLQAKFPNVLIRRINKVQGQPFLVQELVDGVTKIMEE